MLFETTRLTPPFIDGINKTGFTGRQTRAMTAPVAFYVQRSVGGELRPVYERNGVRWTEGGQKEPHFRFESLFQPSIYLQKINTYRLLGAPGICADSSCTLPLRSRRARSPGGRRRPSETGQADD